LLTCAYGLIVPSRLTLKGKTVGKSVIDKVRKPSNTPRFKNGLAGGFYPVFGAGCAQDLDISKV